MARRDYLLHKERARTLVREKLTVFNAHYGYVYGRVSIRATRSRWGSCSRAGNLNFNYRIAQIPEQIADYIIVHELCHLKEFNHSSDFWTLVSETIPDWKERRSLLKRYSTTAPRKIRPTIGRLRRPRYSSFVSLVGKLLRRAA